MRENSMFNRASISGLLMFLGMALGASSASAAEGPGFFAYEGRVFDSSGNPSNRTVKFTLKLFSPDGTCLLRSEVTDSVDLSQSSGFFSVNFGNNTVRG